MFFINFKYIYTLIIILEKEFFMYSMHLVDGIYIVDQFDGFTIPDTSLDLENLSDIIQSMIKFKVKENLIILFDYQSLQSNLNILFIIISSEPYHEIAVSYGIFI